MSQPRLTIKVLALSVTLAVAQGYVQASLLAPELQALPAVAVPGAQALSGRLTTRGNQPITVNGNSAKSGETIFSDQQLQTPDGVGATVQLGRLGRVDLAPNTNVTITFTDGRITVNLVTGCVVLSASRGVSGSVTGQGQTQQTDVTKGGVVDICAGATSGAAPVVGQGAAANAGAGASGVGTAGAGGPGAAGAGGVGAAGGVGGSSTAVVLGAIGFGALVTTAAIIAPCRRGPNPSPGVPRGRNDECR